MRRWAVVVGTGIALALMLATASTAEARDCNVPKGWRGGWPPVIRIEVYGGMTCHAATKATRTLVEALRAGMRDGDGFEMPPVAGVLPDLYRCRWRDSPIDDRGPRGTCSRGRKQFRVSLGV